MTDVTSKMLHERTGHFLDRAKRGERFRVLRDGKPDGLLVPITEQIDPSWDEIMADVRAARAETTERKPNPVLEARNRRNHATRLR